MIVHKNNFISIEGICLITTETLTRVSTNSKAPNQKNSI